MYLSFSDLYTNSNTKHVSLDVLAPPGGDAMALEGLRELKVLREQSACGECLNLRPGDVEYHIQSFEKYLALLTRFLARAKELNWPVSLETDTIRSTGFLWSSPLSSLPSSAHFSLLTAPLEHAMTLTFYAAALQEHAIQLCHQLSKIKQEEEEKKDQDLSDSANKIVSNTSEQTEETVHTSAATLFRRAAGIYAHIRTNLLHDILEDVPADAPYELTQQGLEVLETLALARAQEIVALKAEHKKVSYPALVAVHRGAVDLFESAAAKAKILLLEPSSSGGSKSVSERLRRYLAISSELHQAIALRLFARYTTEESNRKFGAIKEYDENMMKVDLKDAAACIQDALARVRQCIQITQEPEWLEPLRREELLIEKEKAAADRLYMWNRPPAPQAPPLPEGKVLVAPVLYESPPCTDAFFL